MLGNKNCFFKNIGLHYSKSLLSFLLIIIFYPASAQNEKGLPFINNYTSQMYNARPENWSIIQGDNGVIYFGNENNQKRNSSIIEYDGVHWNKVGADIISAINRCFKKDQQGTIYYGSYADFGYLVRDSIGKTVQLSLLKYVSKNKRDFTDVWSLQIAGNDIYFQSRERLFRLTKNGDTWIAKTWEPATHFMYSFYLDGILYVHQQAKGLFKMINDSLVLVPNSEFLGKERMQIMLPYKEKKAVNNISNSPEYLIGTFSHGLYIFDGKNFKSFATQADSLFKNTQLYKGIQINDNYALSVLGHGVVIINPEGKIIQVIDKNAGLQSDVVPGLFLSKGGDLWLAMDNGIARVNLNSPFTQFNSQSGISASPYDMARLPDGSLYVGTNNGLLRYNPSSSKFILVDQIPRSQVFSVIVDGNTLLVSGDGLYIIKDGKAMQVRASKNDSLRTSQLSVSKKYPDLLYAGTTFGLTLFTRDKSKETGWRYLGYLAGINAETVTLAETEDGSEWMGSTNGKAFHITLSFDKNEMVDISKTSVETFTPKQGLKGFGGQLFFLNHTIYFLTDSATLFYDETKKEFAPASLFGFTFFNASKSKDGKIWLASLKNTRPTLVTATPESSGYLVDSTTLLSGSPEDPTGYPYFDTNGIVWILHSNGLTRYDPKIKTTSDQSYKTLITGITSAKKSLDPFENSENKTPEIKFKNNSLRFEYAAPFYESEDKIQYQTWLEGFEKTWSDWDKNTYKEYTNLSPGKYTFHVRAKNIYHKISEAAVYSFTILSPWYSTWWAYLLYALIAILLIYFFIKYRTRQLEEKHRELEKTIDERTAELSSRVKELALINNVQEGLVSKMDMQSIYDLVGNKIRDAFDAQVVMIGSFDEDAGLEHFNYTIENGKRFYPASRPLDKLRKQLIETKQKIVIKNKKEVEKWFGNKVVEDSKPIKSAVFVPLLIGDKVKRYVSLQNVDRENAFSDSDVKLLETLANSMSVALENARLFDETTRLLKETEQRTSELAVINSVQEGLVAQMNIQSIYDLVGEKIRNIFQAQIIDIVTYDKKKNLIEDRYAFEKGDRTLLGAREPLGFRKHVIDTRQVFVVNENMDKKSKEYESYVTIGEQPKSAVFVPMITGGEVTGIISLQNLDHENAFSESSINLLTTLANSMSVALKSAGLFDETNRLLKETEQRNAELAVINSVQESLVAKLDMAGIYELVGEKIRQIFGAQVIDIVTYDAAKNLIADQYAYEKGDRTLLGNREPNGFRKHVIKTGTFLLHNENVAKAMREFGNEILIGEVPKSQIYVPMIADGKVKGIISLQNLDHEHAFSDSDVSLLTTLANSMSVALESARLFDETNRLLNETEQRNAELAVINSVQESLVGGMDMTGIYELVGEKMREIFKAQVIDIVTFDAERNVIADKYSYEKGDRTLVGERKPTGFRKHVIQTGTLFVFNENVEKAMKEYGNEILIGDMPKSFVVVPMIADGKVKGIISLQNLDHEHAFSDSDVSLLTTLTNSMSVALESARLFDETARLLKETEQRNAELAVITSVQESLVAKMDVEAIYYLVGEKIREVFNAQVIDITTYDSDTNLIEDKYAYEKGDRTLLASREPSGFRKHVIDSGQMLVINKDMYKQRLKYENAIIVGKGAKSLIMAPLMAAGKVNGVISLQNLDKENAFSDSEISLLSTLVNSMSVALKSARLFDETTHLLKETEQRTAELGVINSVQEGLANELDMNAIYNLVGDRIQKIFNAQVVIISNFNLANKTEHFNYAFENGEKIKVGTRPINQLRQVLINKKHTIYISTEKEAKDEYGVTPIDKTKMPKSLLFVPLLTGNEIKGYVSIQNVDVENAFSDADVRLLETLANSMSVALENARLFDETNRLLKETEQRTAELAVINSVQDGLVREMNMSAIYNLVGNRLCDLFPDTQTLVIRTFDHTTRLEHWQYAIEKGIRLYTEPRPINWINKELINNKTAININENFIETARKFGGATVTVGMPPKSVIFVPMIVGDVVKGSVSLQNVDRENAFNESDLRLLTTLTNSMSVALENARLFDETARLLADAKQRASELSTVNNISKALASQLNPNELIQFVGNQLRDLFNANIVYLALLNKKTKIIHFPYQFGDEMPSMKLGQGLTSKIIINGEPLLINKNVDELRKQLGVQRVGISASSYLGVPIPEGDEFIGVLSVQSTEQENRFNENDQRLLITIASSVGVALSNAQLFEDVEQAKMEAEKATKIAEKANEAKSAFLSTVSHELRTPLTSVLGFAKIINKRLNDKIFPAVDHSDPKTEKTINQVNENLQVVISEGERLTHLINDVLDLAKIEAGRMEWNQENVSMPEVVERAVSATTSLFDQKGIKLIKKIDDNIPDIIGDTDKLIQVVINLFSNAVKFTEKGNVTCQVSTKDNEVVVSVSDTGIGIAKEDYGAVFEQFKQVGGDTLTDKPKGTGLGLPICKEIVEHHGGRIWLESKVGKGSTFSFALPLTPSQTKTTHTPIHLNELMKQLKEQMVFSKLKIDGKNSTILVVDDDDSIRSLLHQELSDAGYIIEEAKDGKMALECIRKNRPDLIILDVMMPEINGFDVAAILKNDPQTMDIPIIILSIVQDKARGFRIGVDRYLTKPIDTAKLFEEVGNLLEQGKSKKKVMVVDEDSSAVRSLTEVLQTKGYIVVESDGKELVEKAISTQPDIIILNSVLSDKNEIVQTLRFEKGLENVLFLIYQ